MNINDHPPPRRPEQAPPPLPSAFSPYDSPRDEAVQKNRKGCKFAAGVLLLSLMGLLVLPVGLAGFCLLASGSTDAIGIGLLFFLFLIGGIWGCIALMRSEEKRVRQKGRGEREEKNHEP